MYIDASLIHPRIVCKSVNARMIYGVQTKEYLRVGDVNACWRDFSSRVKINFVGLTREKNGEKMELTNVRFCFIKRKMINRNS